MSRTEGFSCQDSETLGWECKYIDIKSDIYRRVRDIYQWRPESREWTDNGLFAVVTEPKKTTLGTCHSLNHEA
jgi:hypothetical protein